MPANPTPQPLKPRPADENRFAWLLATLAWAAQMFHFSTDSFSSDKSRSILAWVLGLVHIHLPPDHLRLVNVSVRSFAHVAEYAVLTLLVYRSLAGWKSFSRRRATAFWSAAVAAIFCLSDELHQALVPSRGGSLADCAIDAAGIAMAIFLIHRRSMHKPRALKP